MAAIRQGGTPIPRGASPSYRRAEALQLVGAGTYVFTVANALTANGNVILEGAVDPCNVFWRVPTQATLNGIFTGTVVSNALIALGDGATVAGRALTTANGSVTLANNNTIGGGCSVAVPGPIPQPPPTPVPVPAGPSPDLFIVKAHSGNFVVGTNATYGISLFNSGSVATSGAYTVTDTLPAGLTFVSATGTGWSCAAAGQIVTCTSSTVVTPGPGPNNITITVSPGASAVPAVTNRAVVAGGGDTALTNNTTVDITIVAVPPVPTPVPTLSEWAMIALTVLLAVAGFMALRRRTS